MSFYRMLTMSICTGVLVLGLAGCFGGGGGSGRTEARAPAELQRAAIVGAIQVARSAVDALADSASDAAIAAAEDAVAAARQAVAEADALSAGESAAYDTTLSVIEARLATTQEELRQGRVGEAARLRMALDRAAISGVSVAVAHGETPTLTGTIPGTPPTAVTELRTEAVAGTTSTEGSWTGSAYTASDGTTTDRIVFYTDIEAPGPQPFAGDMGKYNAGNGLDALGNLPIVAGTEPTLIAAPDFPTGPGIRTHEAGMDGIVEIAGTFDGAEGTYVCTPAQGDGCTSSIRAGGGISLTGGSGWTFVPAEDATVLRPDGAYRYFGWWLREAGEDYSVGAFHGGVGGAAGDFADLPRLQGTATYVGPAAGKFVVDPQIGETSAGDFTARATLQVDFGDDSDLGRVTGTVDNFTASGESVPWSVALQSAGIGADGSISARGGDTARTVWSIDGQDGTATGSSVWSGQLHDVDEDRVPTVATGAFAASYGDIARMTGAFGANRQP